MVIHKRRAHGSIIIVYRRIRAQWLSDGNYMSPAGGAENIARRFEGTSSRDHASVSRAFEAPRDDDARRVTSGVPRAVFDARMLERNKSTRRKRNPETQRYWTVWCGGVVFGGKKLFRSKTTRGLYELKPLGTTGRTFGNVKTTKNWFMF